jgi:hypothetical protein
MQQCSNFPKRKFRRWYFQKLCYFEKIGNLQTSSFRNFCNLENFPKLLFSEFTCSWKLRKFSWFLCFGNLNLPQKRKISEWNWVSFYFSYRYKHWIFFLFVLFYHYLSSMVNFYLIMVFSINVIYVMKH